MAPHCAHQQGTRHQIVLTSRKISTTLCSTLLLHLGLNPLHSRQTKYWSKKVSSSQHYKAVISLLIKAGRSRGQIIIISRQIRLYAFISAYFANLAAKIRITICSVTCQNWHLISSSKHISLIFFARDFDLLTHSWTQDNRYQGSSRYLIGSVTLPWPEFQPGLTVIQWNPFKQHHKLSFCDWPHKKTSNLDSLQQCTPNLQPLGQLGRDLQCQLLLHLPLHHLRRSLQLLQLLSILQQHGKQSGGGKMRSELHSGHPGGMDNFNALILAYCSNLAAKDKNYNLLS